MTGTTHEILDIFLAFRTKQIQRAAWQNTMRQMAALPQHLVADVDPYYGIKSNRFTKTQHFWTVPQKIDSLISENRFTLGCSLKDQRAFQHLT